MLLLNGQDLSKSYGGRPLFTDITFGIDEGERLGLLGPNGAGKSTLLKLMAGEEKPDRGILAARRGLRLGYLPQEDVFPPDATVESVLVEALAGGGADETERAIRIEIMLGQTGFSDRTQNVQTLSGGWRKRLALARELIREPDLLLMDEPTNHLDLEGILWLEQILQSAPFAYLVVTHDRYFLQNVTNRIVELNGAYAEGYLSVKGNYSDFLERRADYLAAQAHQQQALASQVRREIEWLRQGAQARSTKEYSRIKAAGKLMGELAEVKFRNAQGKTADIDFSATGRKTRELLLAKGIEKSLGGRTLFRGLDVLLGPGAKLGLLGPNGSGKTSLLRVLTDELAPDRGTVKRADDLRIVYFDQKREHLDPQLPLREALAPNGDAVVYRGAQMHVAAWAKRFLFRTDQLPMSVGNLSGGEQARVLIARLMLEPADLLILDEPTNNLDIPTLEILEESLSDFPGALVLVTHDRFMMDRLCTEILALDGKGGARFFADYHQWEGFQERQGEAPPAREAAKAPPPKREASALSTSERRELGRMEEKIETAEQELATLQARMADPAVAADHVKLQECWSSVQAAQARVAELYARWEELEAKKNST